MCLEQFKELLRTSSESFVWRTEICGIITWYDYTIKASCWRNSTNNKLIIPMFESSFICQNCNKSLRWSWHWQFFSTEFIWTGLLIALHLFIMDDFHERLCSQDNGTLMLKMHVVTATSSAEMDLSLPKNVRFILNEKDCIIWLVQWELLFIIINVCVCLHQ